MAIIATREPSEFLFLPTNQNKTSRKPDAQLRQAINRHVQHHVKRQRRNHPLPSRCKTIGVGSDRQSITPSGEKHRAEAVLQYITSAPATTADDEEDVIDIDAPTSTPVEEKMAIIIAQIEGRPRSYLDTSRIDPFSSSPVTNTPVMAPIYNYYFSMVMPVVEPVHQEREEYNSWLVPLTLANPALLYALLACMAYDLEEISSNGFGPGDHETGWISESNTRC